MLQNEPLGMSESTWALPAFVWILLIATNLPLFLALPLPTDAALYDQQVNIWRAGGVPYQDFFEPNLPGIHWWHRFVRGLLGTGDVALRLADLANFAITTLAITLWLPKTSPVSLRLWLLTSLWACYLAMSEWVHCQRDELMLAPSLLALAIHRRRSPRLQIHFLEGCLWGLAVWIKPFVVVPAALVFLVSFLMPSPRKTFFLHLFGVFLGGLFVGALGLFWIYSNGAWSAFWETLIYWNPEYSSSRSSSWSFARLIGACYRLFPWSLLHLVAVPSAIIAIYRGAKSAGKLLMVRSNANFVNQLWPAAFYLGWLIQSVTLQHNFDYVHAPTVLLALGWLATCSTSPLPKAVRFAWIGFAMLVVVFSPLFHFGRLSVWPDAMTSGGTPAVRDRIKLLQQTSWQDLDAVARFLKEKDLQPGELTCINSNLIYLHSEIGLTPSTRFGFLDSVAVLLPSREQEIAEALENSRTKFAVVDLTVAGFSTAQISKLTSQDLKRFPARPGTFPWGHSVVFRAGRYQVHETRGELGKLQIGYPFQAN